MTPTELVLAAVTALFVDFDQDAATRLLAEDYIQHNPALPTGSAPIIGILPALQESGFKPELHRVIAEGDLVALHVTYHNAQAAGAETLVGFDIFRVEDGKVVEHWDNLQPEVPADQTASGNSMTDGATEILDEDKTAENKALVMGFMQDVLGGAAPGKITDYISTETYIQHNPNIDNGLAGLGAALEALAASGQSFSYTSTPMVIAQGNFVLAASEGVWGETPTAFYDLFRVDDGKIVEHWDVLQEIPAQMAHDNGKF